MSPSNPQVRGRERRESPLPLGDKGVDEDHRMTRGKGASLRGERSE